MNKMDKQKLTSLIESLEKGIILTSPRYLEHGSWRVEIHEKGKLTPKESFHFLARQFLEPEQMPKGIPQHYVVGKSQFYDSTLKNSWVVSIIDVKNSQLHVAENTAKERAEALARAEIPKLEAARDLPYLGEVSVKSKGEYEFKKAPDECLF